MILEHLFENLRVLETNEDQERLYVSEKLLGRISKYLEKEPGRLRMTATYEDGWFNKKESYVRKRLKHDRNDGRYYLAISDIYRSYIGKRITKYVVYWLSERDIFYINNDHEIEMTGEMVPVESLKSLYRIVCVD